MTQDMTKDMILHTMTKKLVCNWRTRVLSAAHSSSLTSVLTQGRHLRADEITSRRTRDYGSCPMRLRLVVSLFLMLVLGVNVAWGEDYSGVYYIKHNADNSYYLCTSTVFYDGNHYANSGEMPYLTTAKSSTIADWENEAVWRIIKSGDYYYVVHAVDGKYLTYNDDPTDFSSNDGNRLSLHLQYIKDEEKSLFNITKSSNWYNISPLIKNQWSLNPAGSNDDNRAGTSIKKQKIGGIENNVGGLIGLWLNNNANSKWQFEAVTETKPICEAPTFTNNGTLSISCNTTGAKIYYTTDGSTVPTTSSTNGTSVIVTEDIDVVWARATTQDSEPYYWSTLSVYEIPQCEKPIISIINGKLNLSCATDGVTFYYTINGSDPTTEYDPNNKPDVAENDIIKAVATKNGYHKSNVAIFMPVKTVHNTSEMNVMYANYILASDFTISSSIGTEAAPFCGVIDGGLNTISVAEHPLVAFAKDATIKNVIISSVGISNNSGHAGAIANVAKGETRIYNCGVLGGTVSGKDYVGGIVGLLDDRSRVINCYSYANVTSGSDRGGIVGYNNYASKAGDIRTIVMNCMFYGSIDTGGNVSPVYGGLNISNLNGGETETGLNTYNYYRYETNKNISSGKYNGALAAKDQYLTRFELYRQLLNSNRKLAALYAIGDPNKGVGENNEIAKWVLDKSIAPYPILKKQGYYPSVVNYDPVKYYDDSGNEVQRNSITKRNKGKILGELTVNISAGSHGSIKSGKGQIKLKRIDKDYDNYNFNYDKVQLPYFNEVCDGNYTTDGWVVTGWKVTVTGGTNHYTSDKYDVTYDSNGKASQTPFNFADRNCTEKDNYANSKRVFSQGAYFDVPYGVSEISIEAYWGKAAYICDLNYDVVYKNDFTTPKDVDVLSAGEQKNNLLANGQTLYHAIGDNNTGALASLTGIQNPTVYDYALVLVGNLHLNAVPSNGSKPFTIMSADFDNDNEPDYSLIYSHPSRNNGAVSPIRFDFINVPGTTMAQKPNDASKFLNVSIFKPKGWFEITNTCLISIVQFEYDNAGKTAAPLILLGGEYEQFVSTQNTDINAANYNFRTTYIHIGSNAYFKEFNNGTHSDGWYATPHVPISATGGDYDKFYLSGAYRPDAAVADDDAEGYISGGRYGEVAGAGQQQINGNVYWQIYDADITGFYGGGINSEKPITGNITVDIFNSNVTTYCGGPKFGDMQKKKDSPITITYATDKAGTPTTRTSVIDADRTVTTNATGCTFGDFYGAGYGGISYVRKRTHDNTAYNFTSWVNEYNNATTKGYYFNGVDTSIGKDGEREPAGPGVAVDFDYEFFVWSDGRTGGRFYIKYASLSFATTNGVTSTLNDCDITGSFYGGGRLGKVDGTINSTLNGCRVTGDVFGAGYSADKPKVPYRDGGFTTLPKIDTNAGVFADGVKSTTVSDLELNPGQTLNNGESAIGTSGKIDTNFTEADLNALGTVSGVVTLNVKNYTSGSNTIPTAITGNVYGGGAMSAATSNVFVNISGNSTVNNVYGGGDLGAVGGNTTVTLKDNVEVNGNVFGGGNEAPVSGSATVNIED